MALRLLALALVMLCFSLLSVKTMKGVHHLSNVHVNSVLNGKEEYLGLQENLKQAASHMEEMQE